MESIEILLVLLKNLRLTNQINKTNERTKTHRHTQPLKPRHEVSLTKFVSL